tara:strand:- start:10032 stop:10379 length:348 start_codon:yes stop_codon:yes gene_type:complete
MAKRPLDKFRVKQASGQRIVKSGFNPGRNASWDWNELLTTIEANFELDFDLESLEAQVQTNKTTISTNATAIVSNLEKNNVQEVEIAALNAKFVQLCACLASKVEGWDCPACEKK